MNLTSTPRIPRFVAAGTVAALAAALTFSAVSPAVAAAPIGGDDAYAVTQDTTLNVVAPGLWANDSDPDGDPLDYQSVWAPTGGALPGESLNVFANGGQGAFAYTPPTGFTGTRTWAYYINDGNDVAGPMEVTFTITAPVTATAPVAVADAFDVIPDTPLVIPAPGLYANDYDTDGDSWSYKFVLEPFPSALPGESLDISAGNGEFTYTPPTGFIGTRVWRYSIQGDDGESELVDITFTVAIPVVPNAVPMAVADAHSVTAGVPFIVSAPGALGNDTDADADPLEVNGWDAPAGGLLAGESFHLNVNGSFEYEAPAAYSGTRVFEYRVTDGTDTSADGTITFTVSLPAPNTTPIALPDAYTTTQDTPLVVGAPGVLGNDSDADADPLSVSQVFVPVGGTLFGETLVVDPDGSFEYTPPAGFTGVRTWHYEATDGTDTAGDVDIAFTVEAPAPAPAPESGPELETEATGAGDGTTLAATGDDSAPLVAVIAALILAMGATLVRSSRRVA